MKTKILYSLILGLFSIMSANGQNIKKKVKSDYSIRDFYVFESRIQSDVQNIKQHGIKKFGKDSVLLLTGYSYGEFYDWDLYFENIYLSYFGVSDYCFSNLKEFLKTQFLSGFIPRTLKVPRMTQHFKPFLAQIALLGSKQTTDYQWLLEKVDGKKYTDTYNVSYYERLKRSIEYWFWHLDFDKNGLPVWNSADHSGMDNQSSRAGKGMEFRVEGVDLACYLYRELKAMAVISGKLGFDAEKEAFLKKAENLGNKILETFWDETENFFYDRDEKSGELVKVKSVSGFLPLYIGIVPKENAEKLIKQHLLNKKEFWLEYPIATYSKTEPDFTLVWEHGNCNWRGTSWVPTNYMIFHGLMDYGYYDVAKELVEKTFDMVYHKNDVTREYYNSENGDGIGLNPFWGWSTLAYFMPFELELNYNPMEINDEPVKEIASDILNLKFRE